MGYGVVSGLRASGSSTTVAGACSGESGNLSKSASSRDRVLVAYDKESYALVSSTVIDLDDLSSLPRNSRRFKRNNVAVAACLKHSHTKELFVVASVHLYWNPASEDVKLLQSKYISLRLSQFAASVKEPGEELPPPIIVCGDFNSLPKSDGGVYDFWTLGSADATKVRSRIWDFYSMPELEDEVRGGDDSERGRRGRGLAHRLV